MSDQKNGTNPEEIQNVAVPIQYVSRTGRTETVTFTVALQTAVSNAKVRETQAIHREQITTICKVGDGICPG